MSIDPFGQLADLAAAPAGRMAPALLDLAALAAGWSRVADDPARPLIERAAAVEQYCGALAAEADIADDFAAQCRARRTGRPARAGTTRLERLQVLADDESCEPLDRWRAQEALAGYRTASPHLGDALRALAGDAR